MRRCRFMDKVWAGATDLRHYIWHPWLRIDSVMIGEWYVHIIVPIYNSLCLSCAFSPFSYHIVRVSASGRMCYIFSVNGGRRYIFSLTEWNWYHVTRHNIWPWAHINMPKISWNPELSRIVVSICNLTVTLVWTQMFRFGSFVRAYDKAFTA